MFVHIRPSIESVHLIRKEKRLLLRGTKDLRVGTQPEIQAAGTAFRGTADNEIWEAFLHEVEDTATGQFSLNGCVQLSKGALRRGTPVFSPIKKAPAKGCLREEAKAALLQ